MNICLLNDSFPPLIDGVSNTIKNYAGVLNENENDKAVVVTPDYPKANDSLFNYPIYRYPSIDFTSVSGYYAGAPFSPYVNQKLEEFGTEIMHSHCPFASTLLARAMKKTLDVPVVLTYHTKFDIEIEKALRTHLIQDSVKMAVVNNISSCDEVWVVSDGAGKNLRSMGYKGDYVVMENGVDVPKGRMDIDKYMKLTRSRDLDLPNNVPVFLFVGRIYWYKGLRIILNALSAVASGGLDFRMVFIGGGREFDEVKAYSESLGLSKKVFFTGPIYDREELTAWYNRADLFLFPSTYDTNGLVVREAAAVSLPSVVIKDSCASEGIVDGVNGFLIEENSASLAVLLTKVCMDFTLSEHLFEERRTTKNMLRTVGQNAADQLYISWPDAIAKARERYGVVIDNYKAGLYKDRVMFDRFFKVSGNLMDLVAAARLIRSEIKESFNLIDDLYR